MARRARAVCALTCVLLDIWMPDVDGITLLKEWRPPAQLTMPVIMMSGHGTIDTAVEATPSSARDGLPEKPIIAVEAVARRRAGGFQARRGAPRPRRLRWWHPHHVDYLEAAMS